MSAAGGDAAADTRPLAGRRILITRARAQAGRLSAELAKLGAEPVEVPAIEIAPPESFDVLDAGLRAHRDYGWLIVTSANAVRAVEERGAALGIAPAELAHLKIAAIGATTSRAVREAGWFVDVMPSEYVAESLVSALGTRAAQARVLIARAAAARDVIPEALAAQGAQVTIAEAYRTVVPRDSVEKIRAAFASSPPDAATFTSSSTVTNFFQLLHEAGCERPSAMLAVSIGPVTSQMLRDAGWEPAAEASPHDVAGLVQATVRALKK